MGKLGDSVELSNFCKEFHRQFPSKTVFSPSYFPVPLPLRACLIETSQKHSLPEEVYKVGSRPKLHYDSAEQFFGRVFNNVFYFWPGHHKAENPPATLRAT